MLSAGLALALCGCSTAVLDTRGPIGDADRTILLDSLAIMLAIVIPTILCGWAFAWWFRASNTRAKHLPTFDHSGKIELVVWSIPLLTITLLGGVIWVGSHELDPARPIRSPSQPIEVQVVSLDWKWLFIYPNEGVASVNRLVIPVGAPVHFTLTSASVMNAFFIPRLGSMIYTMNGMADQLNLEADQPGIFFGEFRPLQRRRLSRHALRRGRGAAGGLRGLDGARPDGAGPVLDAASYTALEQQSRDVAPFTYSAAAPGLFQQHRQPVHRARARVPHPRPAGRRAG